MAAPLFETTVKFGRSMMKLVYRSAPHLIGVGGYPAVSIELGSGWLWPRASSHGANRAAINRD